MRVLPGSGRSSPAMAFLIFETAAARAGIVATYLAFFHQGMLAFLLGQNLHHPGGRLFLAHKLRHDLQGPVDMAEKGLVTGAQIVQSRFTLRSRHKPVLGTLPLAGEPDLTFTARVGKAFQLVAAEGALRLRGHQLQHVSLLDIAEKIIGLHEMIAGIKIAVML